MTDRLSAAEQELLEQVLTGGLAADASAVRAAAAASPPFAEELAELTRLQRTLDLAAAEEKAVRTVSGPTPPALTARLDATLQGLARPAGNRRLWGRRLAALSAVLLVAWTLWLLRTDTTGVPEQWLGPAWVRDLTPGGGFEQFNGFRWEGRLPQDGAFEVVVYARDADGKETEVARSRERLVDSSWQPPPEFALPARFRWEVLVHGPGGFLRRASAEAWRAPR